MTQYYGNDHIKFVVDENYRLSDGTYFIGQNEKLKRCFVITNENGEM